MVNLLMIAFAVVQFFLFSSCTKKESAEKRYNIVLIAADTLRADFLSCYGNKWIETPSVDALAGDGIIFENAVSQASWTLPSHATLMTSRYPLQHGCLSYNNPLSETETTLAEVLKRDGYKTGAFISTFLVSSKFGFNQGFDTFDEDLDPDYQRPVAKFHDKTLKWIENNKDENFFLWLHYFEPHYPYLEHSPYTDKYEKILNGNKKGTFDRSHEWIKETFNKGKDDLNETDINRLKSLYGGEVSYLDGFIGEVIAKLKEEGVYDNTIIVFTSDHGEMLGEQHIIEHGDSLFQPEINVPLIFKIPSAMKVASGRRINSLVELTDVMPTLLGLLDINTDIKMEGKSLYPLFSGDKTVLRKYAFSEVHNYKSIINDRWKLIMSLPVLDSPMLFNLEDDPGEKKNIYYSEIKKGGALRDEMLRRIENLNNPEPEMSKVSSEDEKRLKSLGYINQGASKTLKVGKYPPYGLVEEINRGKIISTKGDKKTLTIGGNGFILLDDNLILSSGDAVFPLPFAQNNGKEITIEFWIKPGWKWRDSEVRKVISLNGGKEAIVSIDKVPEAVDTNDGKVYRGAFLRVSVKGEDKVVYYDIAKLSDNIEHHLLFTWKDASGNENGVASLLIDGIKEDFSPELSFQQSSGKGFDSVSFYSENSKSSFRFLRIYENYYNPPSIIIPVFRQAMKYADEIYSAEVK